MEERIVPVRDGVGLHVGGCGAGPDVVVLSGGPGCVHYLEDGRFAPAGTRCWFPEPRGVGRSGGGPHDLAQAVADLEDLRVGLGVGSWVVLGHSWGCDLAVRYALDHPSAVTGVVGVAGHGLHKDRSWSAAYEARQADEQGPDIPYEEDVWRSLQDSFLDWIHEPGLFRALADSEVAMAFVVAGADIRPPWPLHQLAALVPRGSLRTVPGVAHDFWRTHPGTWRTVVTEACAEVSGAPS